MKGNVTLTIIKPGAVRKQHTGPILAMVNESGFQIAAMKMIRISREQAEAFYAVHRSKPFFEGLVDFITSGPVVVAMLKKDNAVEGYRKLIGATNPDDADEGTIRRKFAESLQRNAVHGSDSDKNAEFETDFFFSGCERFL